MAGTLTLGERCTMTTTSVTSALSKVPYLVKSGSPGGAPAPVVVPDSADRSLVEVAFGKPAEVAQARADVVQVKFEVAQGQASVAQGQASAAQGQASAAQGQASVAQGQASVAPGQAGEPASYDLQAQQTANGSWVYRQRLHENETIQGLDKMLEKGQLTSFSRQGDEMVMYAEKDVTDQLRGLTHVQAKHGLLYYLGHLSEVFLPPDMDKNCAPEYLKYRLLSLGAAVCAGGIGFMNSSVLLNAIGATFHGDTQAAAAAAFVNTLIERGTSLSASFLAKHGDADPKSCLLISSGLAVTNTIGTLTVLSAFPGAWVPVTGVSTVVGALAGTIGGAAGVNIGNHMAKPHARGLVGSKNANQDLIAGLAGMPLGYAISKTAQHFGLNPYMTVAATLGPALAACTLLLVKNIRLERLSGGDLDQIVDHFVQHQAVPEAPQRGLVSTLKRFLMGEGQETDGRIQVADRVEDVVPPEQASRVYPLMEGDYLVNVVDGQARLGVRRSADLGNVLRGWMHARLVDRGLQSPLWPELQKRYGADAGVVLVDLAGRGLPEPATITEGLDGHGWNENAAGIRMARLDATWGHPPVPSRVSLSMQQYTELLQHPDDKTLDRLLEKPAAQPAVA